ncbi:MAG: hypothetical protein ACI4WG_03650 [Erysipelotrichaceae bacterium]
MKKKLTVLLAVLALVTCMAAGATLAWLTTKTDSVVNTFTYGDINIKLEETTADYKMVPGNIIEKDPTVTVVKDSEACWLFVKVVESENFDDFITYTIADGWTQLEDENCNKIEGVYWRSVDATTEDVEFSVLSGDSVTVLNTVTKEMLNGLTEESMPTLTFTAYACQSDNVTSALQAWSNISE